MALRFAGLGWFGMLRSHGLRSVLVAESEGLGWGAPEQRMIPGLRVRKSL